MCRACGRRASAEVDHIVPLSEGGADVIANMQGLCRACHRAKTCRESATPKVVMPDGSPIVARIAARDAWYRRKAASRMVGRV